MVLLFKNEINKVLLRKYKNYEQFRVKNPQMEMTNSTVKSALNPYTGANIVSLYKICEALGLEIVIKAKNPAENVETRVTVEESQYKKENQLELDI